MVPADGLADLRARASRAHSARVRLAREDPNTFAELVITDERSGRPIRQAPTHVAWHGLMSRHRNLIIWSHVEGGKTTQMSIARVLWELGRDPSLRAVVMSRTHEQAGKIVRAIAKYVEDSKELHEVFPNLVPSRDKKDKWTGHAIAVRRPGGVSRAKDPSVQAFGVHGAIIGSRVDLVVVDDVLDQSNTLTPRARDEVWSTYQATVPGRLSREARVVVVGNAWHPGSSVDGGDLMHRLAKMPGWAAFRYPVVETDAAGVPKVPMTPRWPERWDVERIERTRTQMVPAEFARQMLCEARDDSTSRFQAAWIDRCLRNGEDMMVVHALAEVPRGCRVYTGVDLGAGKQTSDFTVLFHLMVMPDGMKRVLAVEAGRWLMPEITRRVVDAYRRYGSIFVVEDNATQALVVQQLQSSTVVPVIPHTTGRNKVDPHFGIEGTIAAEMAAGKWIIPNRDGKRGREIDLWISEMLYYDPAAHTGDRLMASWIAAYAANRGVAGNPLVAETGRVDLLRR